MWGMFTTVLNASRRVIYKPTFNCTGTPLDIPEKIHALTYVNGTQRAGKHFEQQDDACVKRGCHFLMGKGRG